MKRFVSIFLAFTFAVSSFAIATPAMASAESSTTVQLSQSILPPNCYDTVMVNAETTDYIAVWECEVQRP